MEENKTDQPRLGGADPALSIYQDTPADHEEKDDIKEPQPDKSDFAQDAQIIEETTATKPVQEPEPETVEAEEVKDDEKDELDDIKEQIFESLLEPDTLVELIDMIASRGGTLMPGTKREDWALEDYEKDMIKRLLSTTVKEEGIEFWPAKYWLILAIIFIYGFKSIDNIEIMKQSKLDEEMSDDDLKEAHEETMKKLRFKTELAQAEKAARDTLSDIEGPSKSNGYISNSDRKPGYYYDDDGHPVLIDGHHLKKPGRYSKAQREKDEITDTEEA